MDKVEKVKPVPDWSQLAALAAMLEEEENDTVKIGNFTAVDDKKVSIPPKKVPEDTLKARSVATVADPRSPTGLPPRSWREFTETNTANLTEDKIAQLLSPQEGFDPSDWGFILLMPDGYRIAAQLVNRVSEKCLLDIIGGNFEAARNFMYIFFEEKYCAKKMGEPLTKEEVDDAIRLVGEGPFPQDLSQEKFEELVGTILQTILGGEPFPRGLSQEKLGERMGTIIQTMLDILIKKNRREEFESQLRGVVDLIVKKLPKPNAENQARWDNIHTAIKTKVSASQRANEDEDSKGKLRRARARLPFLNF
ncbi:MAG: hypothetical protein LBJ75_04585 [Puniceicoccales bacterium]|jgi:hypothetical protein|nr:hypothetical protein [Puniceicoccales bacterium]